MNQDINYSAFERPAGSKLWYYPGIACVGLFAIFATIAGLQSLGLISAGDAPPGDADSTVGALMMITFVGMWASLGVYAFQQAKIQKKIMQQFLQDNSWKLINAPADAVATTLLGVGGKQTIAEAYSGTYKGHPFVLALYQFTVGAGKSRELYNFLSLHFKLSQQFPLMVLDNKQNDYFKVVSDLPSQIPDGKVLQLEGDFNERFRITVVPNTERDVLQVLTPDFMSELLDRPTDANGELGGDNLYITQKDDEAGLYSKKLFQSIFSFADVALKNLSELSPHWQASSSQETIDTMAAAAMVPRSRLMGRHRRLNVMTIITIIFYTFFAVWFFTR